MKGILGVLIGEQAMAVYCSHHGRGGPDGVQANNTPGAAKRATRAEPVSVGGAG